MAFRTQSSLNPGAPAFFPKYHHNHLLPPCVTFDDQYLPTLPIFSSPNPNPNPLSYNHYSTPLPSSYLCYHNTFSNYHIDPPNKTAISTQNHDFLVPTAATKASSFASVSEQTPLEHEAKMELPPEAVAKAEPVSSRLYEKKVRIENRCFGFNGRSKGHGNGHARKERARSCNGDRTLERQYCYRRNSRSCIGAYSKHVQHHPVVPLHADGENTTVMIRNIPNRYTRDMLMDFLDNHCKAENEKENLQNPDSTEERIVSAFDFLYLPMDFGKGTNKGYAFVNFTDARAVWKFHLATHNQPWDVFQSHKIRQIVCARVQGKEELVRHFEKSYFECETDKYLPVSFSPARDGSSSTVSVEGRTVGRRIGINSS